MKRTKKLAIKRTTITQLTPAQLAEKAGAHDESLTCQDGTWYSCGCGTWGLTCFSCEEPCWPSAGCY